MSTNQNAKTEWHIEKKLNKRRREGKKITWIYSNPFIIQNEYSTACYRFFVSWFKSRIKRRAYTKDGFSMQGHSISEILMDDKLKYVRARKEFEWFYDIQYYIIILCLFCKSFKISKSRKDMEYCQALC